MSANPRPLGDSPVLGTVPALNSRPQALAPIWENFPPELTERPQWVVWRYEWRNNADDPSKSKWTKPPFNARTGGMAKANDGSTWSTFEEARRAYHRGSWDGVGFMLHLDAAVVGVDFDKCAPGGELVGDTARWVALLDTYTERSPSGAGIRCFALGTLPVGHRNRNAALEVEIYRKERFLTVTGHYLESQPRSLNERSAALLAFHDEVFPSAIPARGTAELFQTPALDMDDAALLEVAFAARNGAEIRDLYSGGWAGKPGDSEADLALCGHLCFYAQGDPARIDRMFRASGLMRDKWDERRSATTYGGLTITKAMQGRTEFYTPPRPRRPDAPTVPSTTQVNGNASDVGGDDTVAVSVASPAAGEWSNIAPLGQYALPDFPVDAFPSWIANHVEAVAVDTQTPPDMAAMQALAALATCVQKKFRAAVKQDWDEPLNLYVVTVLGPANRKSAVNSTMMRPIKAFEKMQSEEQHPKILQAQSMRRAIEDLQKTKEKEFARAPYDKQMVIQNELVEISQKLASMPEQGDFRIFADDVTPERIPGLMQENGGRLSVMSAEGDLFDVMTGRYSAKANLGVFLKGHAGETLTVDRTGRKGDYVDSPALTIGLAVQPDVLRGLMETTALRGRGLIGRILYSLPKDYLGFRDVDPPAVPDHVSRAYADGIKTLLELPMARGAYGKDDAASLIRFSPEARRCMVQYQAQVEALLRPGADLSDIQDWGGKLCGAVVRIAGLLHLADRAYPSSARFDDSLSVGVVERAIRIGKYLVAHAHAAFAEMGADAVTDGAMHILAWLDRHAEELKGEKPYKQGEMYRLLNRRFKDPAALEASLQVLADRGYIRFNQPTAAEQRHNGKPAIVVNPQYFEPVPVAPPEINVFNVFNASETTVNQSVRLSDYQDVKTQTGNPVENVDNAESGIGVTVI